MYMYIICILGSENNDMHVDKLHVLKLLGLFTQIDLFTIGLLFSLSFLFLSWLFIKWCNCTAMKIQLTDNAVVPYHNANFVHFYILFRMVNVQNICLERFLLSKNL